MISICPCCREPSPESKKDRKLEREIMKSQVKCTRTDCHWEGKLGDLEDHQKEDDECPMLKGIMMNLLSYYYFTSSFACPVIN